MATRSPTRSPARAPRPASEIDVARQRTVVLRALRRPPPTESDDSGWPQQDAFQSLYDLLDGTISRGEGNTCMVMGPKGSGKTRVSY